MEDANNSILIFTIINVIITLIGAGIQIYKAKSERKNIEKQGDSFISDAAESIVTGAKVSNEMLLARLQEMEFRENVREKELSSLKEEMKHVISELADWQDWARRLVHQVKSLGHEPVVFKLNVNKKV